MYQSKFGSEECFASIPAQIWGEGQVPGSEGTGSEISFGCIQPNEEKGQYVHLNEHLIQEDNNREQILCIYQKRLHRGFVIGKKIVGESLSKIPYSKVKVSVISLTKNRCEYNTGYLMAK